MQLLALAQVYSVTIRKYVCATVYSKYCLFCEPLRCTCKLHEMCISILWEFAHVAVTSRANPNCIWIWNENGTTCVEVRTESYDRIFELNLATPRENAFGNSTNILTIRLIVFSCREMASIRSHYRHAAITRVSYHSHVTSFSFSTSFPRCVVAITEFSILGMVETWKIYSRFGSLRGQRDNPWELHVFYVTMRQTLKSR